MKGDNRREWSDEMTFDAMAAGDGSVDTCSDDRTSSIARRRRPGGLSWYAAYDGVTAAHTGDSASLTMEALSQRGRLLLDRVRRCSQSGLLASIDPGAMQVPCVKSQNHCFLAEMDAVRPMALHARCCRPTHVEQMGSQRYRNVPRYARTSAIVGSACTNPYLETLCFPALAAPRESRDALHGKLPLAPAMVGGHGRWFAGDRRIGKQGDTAQRGGFRRVRRRRRDASDGAHHAILVRHCTACGPAGEGDSGYYGKAKSRERLPGRV